MSYQVRAVTQPLVLGEGPHWHAGQQALYFVDVVSKYIHKYTPATQIQTKTKLDCGASFIIPVEGSCGQFVVGSGRRFLLIRWDGEEGSGVELVRELGEVDQHRPQNVINDGKVDAKGRLFAGTMDCPEDLSCIEHDKGSLYRVASAAGGGVSVRAVADKISLANGLAWDLHEKAFYYIDSLEYKLRRYDYDAETGSISNLTYIFDLRRNEIEGLPDGMTIDTDGNLWIALFGRSGVLKLDPRSGKVLQKLRIPAKQVASVTFGGANYDVLFVTTGSMRVAGEEHPPPCGAVYEVTGLGVRGHPNANFIL